MFCCWDTPPWSPNSTLVSKVRFKISLATVAEDEIRRAVVSLTAAHWAATDPDPSEALLTDWAPSLLNAPDEELQDVHLLKKGVDKAS